MKPLQFDRTAARMFRGRGIGWRISALVTATVLLAVGMVTAAFVYNGVTSDFRSRKHSLEAIGYVFASALADHIAEQDENGSYQVLRSIGRIPEISYAAVTDRSGNVLASFGSAVVMNGQQLSPGIGILEALRLGFYPVASNIIKSGEPIGQVILIADISGMRGQLVLALMTALATAAAAVGISLALARKLQRRVTRPILSLTHAIQSMRSARRYEGAVLEQAEGETALLLDSFNAMIEEIRSRDEALEGHRQTLETTVEQRTHELRLARDAAESANAAKSSFLATMSHEIRTPLNGLMVMAELLAGAGLDQRLQRYAEVIVKSGQSLLTVINDILDLSKIEAGKLQLEKIPVNPAIIADDVTSLFWERAVSKNLDLAARVAPGMPQAVLSDPVRLNQILSNFVNNALKFTDHGQVLISLHFDQGHLTLAVTDSGIGIPQKKLDQLFEAFSQADQSITRKFGGSGLGLAICKRLAEAMGGSIGVRSEIGKGSTFWVRIPAVVSAPPLAIPKLTARAAIAVEGLATQSALGTALAAAGYEVEIATGAAHAADAVFASARRLQQLAFGEPRPHVVCLSWIGDSEGEAAIAAGSADDLIILPLRHADIVDMVARLKSGTLRGRSVLDRRTRGLRALPSFKGRRVIVADDNAVNREVLIELLRQTEISVDAAVNGEEALALWMKRKPDLIFMDCSMPEMDGYTATREIRARETLDIAGGHTPVVALTAHVAGAEGDEWRQAGMDAYVAKPFTMNQIVACLDAHFAGKPLMADVDLVPGPGQEEILDPQTISELKAIGGSTKLFERVLDLFASRVPQAVERVDHLAGGADGKALADAAHALKSMCANIGARRALEACHALELAARSGSDFDAGELMAAIIREMRIVMAEVQRLRENA